MLYDKILMVKIKLNQIPWTSVFGRG